MSGGQRESGHRRLPVFRWAIPLYQSASELHHHDLIDVLRFGSALVCFALNAFALESKLAVESDSARVVSLHQELESQHPNPFEPGKYSGEHRRRMSATVKLRRDGERAEMGNVVRPAGQTRGLAEADDRTVDLVYEEITALEQTPEDSAESARIDALERQKPSMSLCV